MNQGFEVVGLYVRDQDEALASYREARVSRSHRRAQWRHRWLTVQHPDQPSFQSGLFTPGPPMLDVRRRRRRSVRSWPKAQCRRLC